VTDTSTAAPQRATLPRELSEFLVELSIGVHRHAMYPLGHPSLDPVVESVVGRLAEILEDRQTLSIGVAQRQLVVEGVVTDQKHPVLADLARRFHNHQLAAVSFEKGVNATDIAGLLHALASDSDHGEPPLGILPADELPRWEHARLHRVGYEHLEISGEDGGGGVGTERSALLWLGLAQAALMSDDLPGGVPEADPLAQGIARHRGNSTYQQVVARHLLRLAEELKGARGGEAEETRRRVSKLLNELDDETLSGLVSVAGGPAQVRRFLLDANQTLAVDSVMKVLRAAAISSEQSISHSMTRLLAKLAAHAAQGSATMRSQADAALRENIEALIEGWELKDPNPDAYTNVLDSMSRAAPLFQGADPEDERLSGADRLVQMALEVDAHGPIVGKAVSDVLEEGGTRTLLAMLQEAPDGSDVAEWIRGQLTSPSRFRHLLASGRVDRESLKVLIERMGSAAVDPLLDVLADSDSRSVRRLVFDALVSMGPFVAQRTVERLQDGRWFVLRNMLSLLQRLKHVPEDFDVQEFLEHPDPRVRREALPLALRKPGVRDRVLVSALADDDERMVRMALLEVQEQVPEPVLPTLVSRVVRAEARGVEIRALGARVLGRVRSPLAVSALVDLVTSGRTLFGRTRMAPPSPAVLAGLRTLAEVWSDNTEVQEVLRMAERSKDPEVRSAVRAEGGGAT
jgi:hypothetical protein